MAHSLYSDNPLLRRVLVAAGLLAVLFCFALTSSPLIADERPLIVMMIAEAEYNTDQTLTRFAREHLRANYRVRKVSENPEHEGAMLGIASLKEADLLVVSVRRKPLLPKQMQAVRDYVAAGKPVIGIRTASHAFSLRNKPAPEGRADWPQFDAEVLGGNYTNHYGNEITSTVTMVPGASNHPILEGIENAKFEQGGSLYKTAPLAEKSRLLLTGELEGHPAEPVAWTFERADGGHSFYTSLGHEKDFENPVFITLFKQAIDWAVKPASE